VVQIVRPSSDVSSTNWTGTYADIDETSSNGDSDFIYTPDKPNSGDYHIVHLGNPTDPEVHTGHTVRWDACQVDGGSPQASGGNDALLDVALVHGALQVIHNETSIDPADGTWTAGSFTLTTGEAGNITDYSDLRLRFNAHSSGGNPASRRGIGVSWAEFEVPAAGTTATPGEPANTATAQVVEPAIIARAGEPTG